MGNKLLKEDWFVLLPTCQIVFSTFKVSEQTESVEHQFQVQEVEPQHT